MVPFDEKDCGAAAPPGLVGLVRDSNRSCDQNFCMDMNNPNVHSEVVVTVGDVHVDAKVIGAFPRAAQEPKRNEHDVIVLNIEIVSNSQDDPAKFNQICANFEGDERVATLEAPCWIPLGELVAVSVCNVKKPSGEPMVQPSVGLQVARQDHGRMRCIQD